MISREIIQRAWDTLQQKGAQEVEGRQLDAVPLRDGYPILTVDVLGLRHLLIPVPAGIRISEDKRSGGIHVLTDQWGVEDEKRKFLDVQCLKPHLNDLFDIVVYEILSELTEGVKEPGQVCAEVLERWRELLSRDRGTLPDKLALIGLWGELWVLLKLCQIDSRALKLWTGPAGARFDFTAKTAALEVKTTTRRKGLGVTIHGHDQLEPPAGTTLHLAVLRIEETSAGGESLMDLIDKLAKAGCPRYPLLDAMAKVGFTVDVITSLADSGFRLLESRLYRVDADFPRIVSSSFASGRLPFGITSITYEVDLSSVPPHPLSDADSANMLRAITAELGA